MKGPNHIYLILLLLTGSMLIWSCDDKEITLELPQPQIIEQNGDSTIRITQEPGRTVRANFSLQAAGGLQSLVVREGNETIDQRDFVQDELSASYDFEVVIPTYAVLGSKLDYTLELNDKQGRSTNYSIEITIDATYELKEETVNGVLVQVISGKANSDLHFEQGKTYVINGTLSVENNAKLIIDAGSTVYFRKANEPKSASRLVISRGSSIQAVGTVSDPIVFTSESVLKGEAPTYEDWGGVYLYGAAPTNAGANVVEDGFPYGGNDMAQNSGRMQFVRIEYAGMNEQHALHLFGVGSGTIIDHIQVYNCRNNAFRIRGGRVNLKYIAGIKHGGYGFWGDEGWQGKGQFWLFQTDIAATLQPLNFWNQARSLELRSHDTFFETSPRTTFQIFNVTLIGNGNTAGTRRGARVRTGSIGALQNMIVTNFAGDGVRVEDLPLEVLGQAMLLDEVRSFGNGANYEQDAKTHFLESGKYKVSEESVTGISATNYVGSVVSSFNPNTVDAWFSSAAYVGAVQNPTNDWTSGGRWFKNMDGSIRN